MGKTHAKDQNIGTNSIQEESALLIQSFWRGYFTKKKYRFKQLPETQMKTFLTLLVGNDPKIKGLEPYMSIPGEKIALIGTSGLRSLALACKLGNRNTPPKLIIIDNSRHVINFWRNLRTMVEKSVFNDKHEFLKKFNEFLKQNCELYRSPPHDARDRSISGILEYEGHNHSLFLENLIDTFELQYVQTIIKSAVIIGQSWTDEVLFVRLKNILKLNGINKIFIYPSNIAHYIKRDEIDETDGFFKNIQIISPVLSIVTDLCQKHNRPENVILATETEPSQLKELIFPSTVTCRVPIRSSEFSPIC